MCLASLSYLQLQQVFCGMGQDGHLGRFGRLRQAWDFVPKHLEARSKVVPPLSFQEVPALLGGVFRVGAGRRGGRGRRRRGQECRVDPGPLAEQLLVVVTVVVVFVLGFRRRSSVVVLLSVQRDVEVFLAWAVWVGTHGDCDGCACALLQTVLHSHHIDLIIIIIII